MTLSLLLFAALASAGEPAACERPLSTTDLAAQLDRVEATFAAADEPAFHVAIAELERGLPCVDAALPTAVVARVHRAIGLGAFLGVKPERSTRAFAAARHLEPQFRFPEKVAPPGGPLEKEYLAIDPAGRQVEPLALPSGHRLLVDGQATGERARDWPALVQVLGEGDATVLTGYLWPGEPLPLLATTDPASTPTALPTAPPAQGSGSRRPARVALWSVAGAAAAGAVASWAIAGAAASDYRENPHTLDELETLRSQANSFTLVACGAGVAAVGSGLGAVLIARW